MRSYDIDEGKGFVEPEQRNSYNYYRRFASIILELLRRLCQLVSFQQLRGASLIPFLCTVQRALPFFHFYFFIPPTRRILQDQR